MSTCSIFVFALLCALAGCGGERAAPVREVRTLATKHGATITVEAGTLVVPENRARPSGRTIELPYYRLRSSAERPATPIVLLAGGPGSSGLDALDEPGTFEQVQYFRSIADVVVFDQRGTGRARPALACEGVETFPLDQPLDLDRIGAAMRRLATACRARLVATGFDLDGLTTVENAADVDALRVALGYPRVSLIGGSYGSHLALAVMRAFPRSIDRVVLFGIEGPDHTWDDPAAKWAALARIAAAAEVAPALRARIPPGGLLAALQTVIRRLEASPVTATVVRDGREVSVVVDATLARHAAAARAGRRSRAAAWPEMILELYAGDYRGLARAALEARTLRIRPDAPMHFTMDCASGVSAERAARYAADPATEWLGDLNFGYRAMCDVWHAPDLGAAFRAPVVSAIPTVLLHGTWDVSTPIEHAREVASTLSNGQLVEIVEGGHGALSNVLAHGNPMRALLASFLRGATVQFPSRVTLPPVSFEPRAGTNEE